MTRAASAMPALTLWQPHASFLMEPAIKRHETRGWRAPAGLVGLRWAIHSAKLRYDEEDLGLCHDLGYEGPLPLGFMLGTAVLTACGPTEAVLPDHDRDERAGDWSPGRWAWRFEDHDAFIAPIPCRGGRGVWWWDPLNPDPPPPARRARPIRQLDLFAVTA
jgi:hypothetical protein